jgi:predicted O-linked N-acetylglucosamine transferase (SPINDLY family)
LPNRNSPDLLPMLKEAVALHQNGQLADAESTYLHILEVRPAHGHAQRLLGVLRHQQGRHAEALGLIDGALRTHPDDAEAHGNRGNVLLALGRAADALTSYDRATALRPDHAGFYNRGNALLALGRGEEAVASYDRAIALKPDHAPTHCNRGNALLALGWAEAAVASYDQALALAPGDAATHYNRGNALMRLARHADAEASYDRAIALWQSYAEAHSNRGNALLALKRTQAALASFDAAIALEPGYAEAHANRGNALLELRRVEEALASYDRALALAPDRAEIHVSRGTALLAAGRTEDALASYDRTIAINPDFAQAHVHRGDALRELRRFADASAAYDRALALDPGHQHALGAAADCAMKRCDWAWRGQHLAELRARITEQTAIIPPFVALVHFDDAALQLRCARNLIGDRIGTLSPPKATGPAWRNDRIKVAYLSADFRRHATAYLIAELVERHDRERFEVIGISFGPDDGSDMRARLEGAFDRFVDVTGSSDEAVAEQINRWRVDIAVDLMGHTQYSRPGILAFRPAPIQASYLGFPGTTGADFIDYVIADPIVLPFDRQPCFAEQIVHLPDCYQVNDTTRRIAPRTPAPQECGLPGEGFVFCCFNTSWKITPAVFDVWMRLLGVIPESVLWLLRDNAEAEANLRTEAAARGVDPARLVFADRLAPEEHLARHRLADLFLDTLPYNAHTTASDALWAGLPLLTCRGETFAARVAASLLNAMGLPGLVTTSLEDYEALALKLGTDHALRRRLQASLEANRASCPLFDAELFRRHLEAVYETMWGRWQRGESPRSFAVERSATVGSAEALPAGAGRYP